jgi:glucokinase|tara:strand:+ start:331 stop:1227 length:897 start_codon:yes stop_codon:yes gene_type:complete
LEKFPNIGKHLIKNKMIEYNCVKLIGVDLGGTKVNVGMVEGAKILRKTSKMLPDSQKDEKCVIDLIINLIKKVVENDIIEGICIGVPSLLDKKAEIVYDVLNIPSWKEVKLASILKAEFGVSVLMENDANCFALGEYYFGLGKRCVNMVGMTLGTGLGTGIISNNQLISGAYGGAGEFGMLSYKDGIIEDYCSGKFFKRHNTTGKLLKEKAIQGNLEALQIFDEFGSHLGHAVKTIMYTVNPEKIIIGGSIAKAAIFFDNALKKSISDFSYRRILKNLKIEYSSKPDIAILGATSLYR